MFNDDRAVLILATAIKQIHLLSDHEAFRAAQAWFRAVDGSRDLAQEHLKIA